MALGERKLKILEAVVDTYVRTGEPVGSKAICEMMQNSVSSATIRNEMADLAEKGLLEQPHTSAGRIPSQMGYRVYLNHRTGNESLSRQEQAVIDSMLSEAGRDPERLLKDVSQTLAALTNYAAVATTPMPEKTTVRSVQTVPVGRRTALVILMTSSGILKNKICSCDFDLTPEILRVISRLFHEKLLGKPLQEITVAYVQTMAAEIGEFAFLVSPVLMAVLEAAREASLSDVCLNGEENLISHSEYGDSELRRILNFLNRRAELANLLNEKQGGARVLIGEESARPELAESSMVITRYSIGGEDAGSIAVIGPTRMNYSKVMANLEYVSEAVGRILTEFLRNE